MGNALLKSLKAIGILGQQAIDEFMGSIHTVASEMDEDMAELRAGLLEEESYLQKYGHLRPGTYDITRLPYRKRPSYIQTDVAGAGSEAQTSVAPRTGASEEMVVAISEACDSSGLLSDGRALLGFISKSIELREYFKFVYTKNISLALEIIADVGSELGFSRKDMAHLDYYSIVNHRGSCSKEEIQWIWRNLIKSRKEEKRINQLLSLPPLVFSEKDFVAAPSYSAAPNFITDVCVEGDIVFLDGETKEANITDKIVVIEKADPGYDWIFTKRIGGLVTKYGGAASHMAIRCSEFGIPAAIGCGDLLFSQVLKSSRVILNCGKKTVNSF